MNTLQGHFQASGKKFVIISSRFNEFIVEKLVTGAEDCLTRNNVSPSDITHIQVPGAWEIPATVNTVLNSKIKPHAIICLGAIIRGDTPHFDYVANEVSKGIATLGLQASIPIIYGIITADDVDQAVERAGTKHGNRGWEAALTAIEMSDLYDKLKG